MAAGNTRWVRVLGGLALLLIGLVWTLQGAGVIGGSAMSGQSQWLIIGVILVVLGLWLGATGLRGGTSR